MIQIEDDKLVRDTPIRQNGEWVACHKAVVITKEEFIACYNAWIKENDNG